jgi:hypothetical protein
MTIFHLIQWMCAWLGLCLAAGIVGRHFGVAWAVPAGIIGLVVGMIVGAIPAIVVARMIVTELEALSNDELRGRLRERPPRAPNFVLHELRSRGEDIRVELPRVLEMMTADIEEERRAGWAALNSVFPEEAQKLPAYRANCTPDVCREVVSVLRHTQTSAS